MMMTFEQGQRHAPAQGAVRLGAAQGVGTTGDTAAVPEPRAEASAGGARCVAGRRPPLSLDSIRFGVCGTTKTICERRSWIEQWWTTQTQGTVFLDGDPPACQTPWPPPASRRMPLLRRSQPNANIRGKMEAHIRCSRIFLELFEEHGAGPNPPEWYVLSDDDTVFALDNLRAVLRRYDPREPYLIGGHSETLSQMRAFGPMVFGGGGIAMSAELVRRMVPYFDTCLNHLGRAHGLDFRIHTCALPHGVDSTYVAGFHQFDLKGSATGVLEAHPLAPFVSMHHMGNLTLPPPTKWGTLLSAMHAHQAGFLQQTVCRLKGIGTVSIAQGFSVRWWVRGYQSDDKLALHQVVRPQATVKPWGYVPTYIFRRRRRDGSEEPRVLWSYRQPRLWFDGEFTFSPLPKAMRYAYDHARTYAALARDDPRAPHDTVEYVYLASRHDKDAANIAQRVRVREPIDRSGERWAGAWQRLRCESVRHTTGADGRGGELHISLAHHPPGKGLPAQPVEDEYANLPSGADITALVYATPDHLPGDWEAEKDYLPSGEDDESNGAGDGIGS